MKFNRQLLFSRLIRKQQFIKNRYVKKPIKYYWIKIIRKLYYNKRQGRYWIRRYKKKSRKKRYCFKHDKKKKIINKKGRFIEKPKKPKSKYFYYSQIVREKNKAFHKARKKSRKAKASIQKKIYRKKPKAIKNKQFVINYIQKKIILRRKSKNNRRIHYNIKFVKGRFKYLEANNWLHTFLIERRNKNRGIKLSKIYSFRLKMACHFAFKKRTLLVQKIVSKIPSENLQSC